MARSWSARWQEVLKGLTLTDLAIDGSGKILLGLGLGAVLARRLEPYAWGLILTGLALSATVKVKYWKRFRG